MHTSKTETKAEDLANEHQAMIAQMDDEFTTTLEREKLKHETEIERAERALLNERKEHELKLKDTMQELNQRHQGEV